MNDEKRKNLKSCELVCQSFIMYVKPDRSSCFKHKHSHAGSHWSKYDLCKTVQQQVSQWAACDRLETDRLFHPLICSSLVSLMWKKKKVKQQSLILPFSRTPRKGVIFHTKWLPQKVTFFFSKLSPAPKEHCSLSVATKARACGRVMSCSSWGVTMLLLLGNCPELQSITLTRKAEL